ncbi:hypothetical protein BZA70DRAFT_311002 [Myxozyma melibiosi]|uniref:Cytochrome c oxidase-assembly factor COX23, mitochondrial n=1 Tax=Myxozyma melibiosi TaxID=54550 RepID=A0ABR1F5N8_9ASCO
MSTPEPPKIRPVQDPTLKPRRPKGQEKSSDEDPDVILKRFEADGVNQMYPDDPKDKRHFEAMKAKQTSKFYDPCKLSAQMSLSCLDRNRYNTKRAKENCKEYFEAYKECKTEWLASRRNYRRQES